MKKEIIETCEIEGWKSKGDLQIYQSGQYYHLIEKRKEKHSGEIYADEHYIPKENVDFLWKIIKDNCPLGEEFKTKYLARKIIELKNLDKEEKMTVEQLMSAIWGGVYRSKIYFPLLYFPLKCLEAKSYLVYFGKGTIIRLSEHIEVS